MRPPGKWIEAALFGTLAVFLFATAARGATAGFLRPAGGQTLQAGQTVPVAWALSTDLADESEMELLLSLDGGRTFRLWVTREVRPDTSVLLWRVPAFPTVHARLALRAGTGDPGAERVRLVSGEFTIEAHGREPAEELFQVGAEWRTRDALALPASVPEPRALEREPPRIRQVDPDAGVTVPRRNPVEGPRSLPFEAARAAGRPAVLVRPLPAASRTAPIPLRE